MILRPPTFNPAIFRHGIRGRIVSPSAPPVISGFAYPANVLTSTRAGQWFVNGQAVIGETGNTYTVRLTDIGALIQCGNSNVLTCWHPNQIAAVARFWWASRNALNSVSPDVIATDGQTVRRWSGIILGTQANQSSAPSQPIYLATGQSGNPSIQFDGVNDFLLIDSTTQLQGQSQVRLIAGFRDTNPTGGSNFHTVAQFRRAGSTSTTIPFCSIYSRFGPSGNRFAVAANRNGTTNANTALSTGLNNGDYNVITNHADFSSGFNRLRINGVLDTSTALAEGAGVVASVEAANNCIGYDGGTEYGPMQITSLCLVLGNISATDLSRIERFIGLMGGRNIPLV